MKNLCHFPIGSFYVHCCNGEKNNFHFCIYSNTALILTVILNLKKNSNIDKTLIVKNDQILKVKDFYLFVRYFANGRISSHFN